ncbi:MULTISPECIES: arabinofuranosyltransferase [unclassified Saccharopolyspora]|nr:MULTISPECIES: arabinofuranosyltransferase [unclassified Saccharopolyspora]MCA1184836.1 galactan 5-O-arabinofuranosyltransferase [Saccharopolyspora sp. 6T]MCA1190561.1 galactan 5-O-arabinofuranosyltransferase [Saccharopolyspora sp. 6V]MCA1226430.1 galactan 5-O-arabinofuranosyltransferase [Saccharopolyspora sp. 6M]MCA1280863.1 galactan 5-O-arabinofuranosyltransferase [Saccharopolyspora sp. 7B]
MGAVADEAAGRAECSLRIRPKRFILELSAAVVLAAVVSLAVQLPLARLGLSEPTELPELAATAGAALLLVLLLGGARFADRVPARLRLPAIWVALPALATTVLAWPLEPTRLYYGGVSVDQMFRMQYLTRLADSPVPADMNYPGIAPYYPAGWFWVGGRFADLTGQPAWAAYKPFALLTIAVTAAVAFTLWSTVVRRRVAVLCAVATTLSGFLHGFDEPYAWMSVAWLAPVAVAAWHVLRCRAHPHRAAHLGIGLFLGFTAITYALYLAFATAVLVAMAAVIATARIRAGDRIGQVAGPLVLRLAAVGAIGGLVALVVWTPFLLAKLGGAGGAGAANRYLPAESVPPFPFLEPTPFGALCLAGFCWLVLACRRDETAAALLVLTGATYAWFALSALAVAAGTTLLAFRTTAALEVLLAAAGVLGLLDLWRRGLPRLRERWRARVAALAVLLGLAGSISTVETALATSIAEAAGPAYEDYYPTGSNAQRRQDPAQPGAWNDELATALAGTTGRPPARITLLTTYHPIMSFAPYWGFQQETPHYANPLAHYEERAALIRGWAGAAGPDELAAMLHRSPYPPPNAFLLRREDDGLHLTLSHDAFPHQPNVQIYDVRFDPALFDSPRFVRRDVGPFAVIALTDPGGTRSSR